MMIITQLFTKKVSRIYFESQLNTLKQYKTFRHLNNVEYVSKKHITINAKTYINLVKIRTIFLISFLDIVRIGTKVMTCSKLRIIRPHALHSAIMLSTFSIDKGCLVVESIIAECKACGLMIRNLEHVITFVPILTMSKKEIKKMVRIFTKALTTILD